MTAITIMIAMLTGPGCVLIGHRFGRERQPRAEEALDRIQAFNTHITTSRGTGVLTLTQGAGQQRYKIAWAAQAPNRLRMTLLMSGYPVETIAATGQWVTLVSHTGAHKPHSAVSADPDLESYTTIPLRLSELVSLLLGSMPRRSLDRAWMRPDTPNTVFASKSFSSQIHAYVTDDAGTPICYRVLDKKMNLLFEIGYAQFFRRDGYHLPGLISIRKGRSQSIIEISLTGMVPNVPVKESVFRLTESGK